jgi:hypothetical protein
MEYFELFSKETHVIHPQVYYLVHPGSNMPVDFVIRYERLGRDIARLCRGMNFPVAEIPHLNKSKRKNKVEINKDLLEDVRTFYKEDFDILGYSRSELG